MRSKLEMGLKLVESTWLQCRTTKSHTKKQNLKVANWLLKYVEVTNIAAAPAQDRPEHSLSLVWLMLWFWNRTETENCWQTRNLSLEEWIEREIVRYTTRSHERSSRMLQAWSFLRSDMIIIAKWAKLRLNVLLMICWIANDCISLRCLFHVNGRGYNSCVYSQIRSHASNSLFPSRVLLRRILVGVSDDWRSLSQVE